MTVDRIGLNSAVGALKQLSRRARDHIERTPRRTATVVPRLEYAPPWATMNSTSPWGPPCSCTRETSGYSPCSRSRVRVSREKQSASPGPARSRPSVARGSHARRTPDGSSAPDAYVARVAFPDPLTAPPRYRPPADLRALENKTEGAEKRYRVMLSDGVHYVTAMLTSSLNQYVADDKLKKFSVIKLKDYFANEVNNRKCVPARALIASPHGDISTILAPTSFFPSRAEKMQAPLFSFRARTRVANRASVARQVRLGGK